MAEQIEQAARTAGRTFNITLAELAGANAGQRNDLLALNQAVYRVPDGTLYTSTGSQLVLAQDLPVTAQTNPLTGGVEFNGIPISTSGLVKLNPGSFVAASTPNLTLLDTGASAGVAMTQIAMLTIPGGVMGPTSRLLLHALITGTGGNSKSTVVRAGPASGTFATATSFGGQAGLTSQLLMPLTPMIWNNGSLNSQKATPSNLTHFMNQGSNSTPLVTASIDTSLDWNIYFGVQMGLLNGGDSMTLHHCYAQILN